jgi:hypothetical protein
VPDGVEIHGMAEPGAELGHDDLGVVAGPVEPAVDQVLHPLAQRVEQRRGDQRDHGHGHRPVERQHVRGQQDEPGVHASEQRGDHRVGDHPADHAAQVVQPVLQHRHPEADGQGRRPERENSVGHGL